MTFFERLTGEEIEQFGRLAMSQVGRAAWVLTLLLLVLWFVRGRIDRLQATAQRRLWVGFLALAAILPPLLISSSQIVGGVFTLEVFPPDRTAPLVQRAVSTDAAELSASILNRAPSGFLPLSSEMTRTPSRMWTWILGGYVGIAGVLLLRVVRGRMEIHRWIRSARRTDDPRTLGILEGVRREIDESRPIRLLERAYQGSPLAVGILRPTILTPMNFHLKLNDAELTAVLAHEAAHLKNRDPFILLCCSIFKAFFFFHPLIWMLSHRIYRSIEFVGDEAGVRLSGEPVAYARVLHRFSSIPGPVPFRAARSLPMVTPAGGTLTTRVRAILEFTPAPAERRVLDCLLPLGLIAAATTILGWAFPLAERDPFAAYQIHSSLPTAEIATLTVGPKESFSTIASAIESARPGDIIRIVGGGEYNEDLVVPIPITLTGESSNPPTLSGTMQVIMRDGFFGARNLRFVGSRAHGIEIFSSTGSRIVIDQCEFTDNGGSGIFADSSRMDFHLARSRFTANSAQGLLLGADHRNTTPQASNIQIEKCLFEGNGTRYPINESGRGRGIQIDSNRGGRITIADTEVFVTEDGQGDRGIHLDSTRLIDYSLTLSNCLIEAPGGNRESDVSNYWAIGLKIKSSPRSIVVKGCRIVGFRHSAEFKAREIPTAIQITDSEFVGFTSGRGLVFQGLRGSIEVDRVVLIGHDGENDIPTGDEALRIKQCSEFTADIRNIVAGNTEEGITIDQCTGIQNVTIEGVVLYRGAGRGEQGIKVQANQSALISIRDAVIDDYETGLDCFKTGFDQSLRLERSRIQATRAAVSARGEHHRSGRNALTLQRCVLIGITKNQSELSIAASIEDEGNFSTVTLSHCTLHDFDRGIETSTHSTTLVSIRNSLFSDWTDHAILHRSSATLDEDRNVFVNAGGLNPISHSPALVSGGGSVSTDDPHSVFANLIRGSEGFLRVLAKGVAVPADGSRPIGALDPTGMDELDSPYEPRGRHHTVPFFASSIEGWLLARTPVLNDRLLAAEPQARANWREECLLPIPEEVSFIREHFAFT